MTATNPYVPRVSIVFDFDRTLATDTIDAICAAWGMTREEWETRYCDPLGEHWDEIIRRGWALIQCGRDQGSPISRDFFEKAAEHVELYPGVAGLKRRLQEVATGVDEELEVELVVLSSGFIEMIERTGVEETFDRT